ncbi:MAG: hypothetical protein A3I44_05355 [Candidatus Sungbacteria bacterium RIFCSPLOWO2_02_FULL_51_17]|uniref:Uncharacterized protein n=1 Tax=Candidatus Sungbacteria bacterium RIFCSPHIGHO2_02_FULL_51_29 TaxID=1802273 RepID=A0A1G2KTF4_9BACT|nr:MAG: hypothetical protein A2676_01070 [Candidatus Sungbacteria bacterium RIFCSPHIGHO2_01_FULL_51_22]OHA01669.1 MAG: hypothetical protein A3C16_04440 [Candidatus Sungbacteria bacterium RIFCSPHIGHO2_02_FULL_51_29]OHA04535.1 MAG: hypothetical protein A3B29_00015 [Candidatus Sungbacteria bacterium RIFCSPLOWO2_01_FULL_51_34]OHA10544.1 MAG: hypothetical protein A3I44_05355 [Candidatus Sungbacteria bacterium RIFCSPLOWO2_02_FULL_51_17]
MAQKQVQGAKGCSKKGRNKQKCEAYAASGRMKINKLRRILNSNGSQTALAWAEANGCLGVLRRFASIKPSAFARAKRDPEFAKFANGG